MIVLTSEILTSDFRVTEVIAIHVVRRNDAIFFRAFFFVLILNDFPLRQVLVCGLTI